MILKGEGPCLQHNTMLKCNNSQQKWQRVYIACAQRLEGNM